MFRKFTPALIMLGLTACIDQELTTSKAAEEASTRVTDMLNDVGTSTSNALVAIENLSVLEDLGQSLEALLGSSDSVTRNVARSLQRHALTRMENQTRSDEPADSEEFKQGITILTAFLRTYVFVENNVESLDDDNKGATFLLHGELLCQGIAIENCKDKNGDLHAECLSKTADPDCIIGINQAEIRLHVRLLEDNGGAITLLIGPEKFAPFVIEGRGGAPNSNKPVQLALEIDFDALKNTVAFLDTFYSDEEPLDLPRTMEGRVRFELRVNGEQDVTLETAILRDFVIEGDTDTGTVLLRFAESRPLFEIRAEGIPGRIHMNLQANALTLALPYADVVCEDTCIENQAHTRCTEEGYEKTCVVAHPGQFTVAIAGASYDFSFTKGDTAIVIKNIGWGDVQTTVKKDDVLLMSLDLNPNSGRRYDLTLTPHETLNSGYFHFSPELDIHLGFYLDNVKADFTEVPVGLLDNTYRVHLFGGEDGPTILPLPENAQGFKGGFQVVQGTLEISANNPETLVSVAEGQCLSSVDTAPEAGHPLLKYLVSMTCP